MKSYTRYVCEYCGYENCDKNEVYIHELEHLGLSNEEYKEWQRLKMKVEHMGASRLLYKE